MTELPVRAVDGHETALRFHATHGREAVLLLPAMGVSARFYDGVVAALAREGWPAASVDLRGQGASSVRASRAMDWGYGVHLRVDLPAAVAALAEATGGPVALLGHSLGGQLGALLLADRPDLVTRLVTVASGLNHADSWVGATRALRHVQTQAAVALSRALGWFPGRSVGFAGRQARTEMADWGRVGLTGRYALAGIDEDLHASLARVSAPVDGFLVPEDDWTPPRSFEGLCALMPAARCRTHRLDGLPPSCRGHFRWAGAPAIVARAVAALLAEPAPG